MAVVAGEPAAATPTAPDSPFPGLTHYTESYAALFFGRDVERGRIIGKLRVSRLTLLYARSGAGKSSLLSAGVAPTLAALAAEELDEEGAAGYVPVVFRSWRGDPVAALVAEIERAIAPFLLEPGRAPSLPGDDLQEACAAASAATGSTLLLILDQFEEFFNYHASDGRASTFPDQLATCLNRRELRVNVLIAIRDDAYARIGDLLKDRIPNVYGNYLQLDQLTPKALNESITKSVAQFNRLYAPDDPVTIEPGLTESVLEQVAPAVTGESGSTDGGGAGGSSTDAAFVQVVMKRLWDEEQAAGSRVLHVETLERLGGATRIVENHLLDALARLSVAERDTAADCFRFLVSRSRTKIAHSASDLADWTERPETLVTGVLETLCTASSGRILRAIAPVDDDGSPNYELFHDILAEPIIAWRQGYEQEQSRRLARRRFLRVSAVLTSLVAVFAGLGVWALVQRAQARDATSRATSLALASTAYEQLPAHIGAGLLLGLLAYRSSPTAQTTSSMISALEAARQSGARSILRTHQGAVYAVSFSPDSRVFATAGNDGSVQLWDARTLARLGPPIRAASSSVQDVAFSPDGRVLATAGGDGMVRLWDVGTRSEIGRTLPDTQGPVYDLAFSPDGRTLATAGNDGSVRLWDVSTHASLGRLVGGDGSAIDSVAFSPDGRTLASGSDGGDIVLWDVRTHAELGQPLAGRQGPVYGLAFSPDGATLAAAGFSGGSVQLWDTRSRTRLGAPLQGDLGGATDVAFSPNGRMLAAAGEDGTVLVWNARTHAELGGALKINQGIVWDVAFSPDGRTLSAASGDGTVWLWNVPPADALGQVLDSRQGTVYDIAFSPDRRTLASGGNNGTVQLWDTRTDRRSGRPLDGHQGPVDSVAFSPDGRTLASVGEHGTVLLWNVATHSQLGGPLKGAQGPVDVVAFSPVGGTLATASVDGTVALWNASTHREIGAPMKGDQGPIDALAFSPDGQTLASAGEDGTVVLWNLATHSKLGRPLNANQVDVLGVAFSPDGQTLATAGEDGTVVLWAVSSHAELGQALNGNQAEVFAVAFSPDGDMLASAGSTGTVDLWDTSTDTQLGEPLSGSPGAVLSVAFSPDGRTLASAGAADTVRLWKGILWDDDADLQAQVCGLVVGNLSPGEWQELAPGLHYQTPCPR